MMRSGSGKHAIDTATDGEMANKRPRTSTTSPSRSDIGIPRIRVENSSSKGDPMSTKIGTSGSGLKPPVLFIQTDIHHLDKNKDNVSMYNTDVPELVWSDCESEYSGRESSSGDEDYPDTDDGCTSLAIREGPYADIIRELRQKGKSRFPFYMMMKLEMNRQRMLNDPDMRNSLTTMISSPMRFEIIHAFRPSNDYYSVNRERETAVIGTARSLEIANVKAMSYFYQYHHGDMCRLGVRRSSRQNRMQLNFVQDSGYNGMHSFEISRPVCGAKDY
ncbi:uncharacterized protein GGS22DRAFT_195922 [Annulohypoxylon maeteangense]|uniref:uncharacterized protein n=1 Tax=Annulohypoxylon maeteangense TaxID=1927788 RepID=UPI002007C597|nr:uncharacterized protein GGS22DRAFT_195922 [Annulohypoxylon maeteangense]KAI0882158.1 hypothetical protein GGS22DRAFT_195922 [Annulohypoxylon maeteangense]